ncbi:uncharacterized protein N0V89_005815 [Didymosphaeria variabile]|uniref:Uncharacterized protein n=1 Tax=Didymosphaeria variabile TaxID=1932322 RepID=A0A9W9CBJ9_9PLEO|nr:uncharacterized protein N0V89_005815 [Didymosphaeria variabile]KAJ4354082.1 hypothetical protein N0V89_005815 [Didymosphaeria variabile]
MDSSPLTLRAYTPAPTPASEDDDKLPQHTKPSRIKVLELPERQRKRAESAASCAAVHFEDNHIRAAFLHISKVRDESHIRAKCGDRTGWAALQVEKRQQRETMPAEARANRLSRPQPRLAVSAPVMAKNGLSRPLPASPVGNAWSGEHYWKPQFCESGPGSPGSDEAGCAHSDAARQRVYDSVVADVETCVTDLKAEIAQSGEQMTDAEVEVMAAMTVLEEKNAIYAIEDEMPVPKDVTSITKDLADDQKQALDQNLIRCESDFCESNWLQFAQNSLQPTTTLEYVRASLYMIKKRRRSAGLEPSEPAHGLVHAVQILEEKTRKLKARDSYEESSDDDMVEYGKFLKSIAEVLPKQGEKRSSIRRDVSESGLGRRRLRGKAPSTLDLETWASELKELEEKGGVNESSNEDLSC